MKTDVIFYSIFKEFPEIFFELIEVDRSEAELYQFTSPEIKQLALRQDGLFLPKVKNSDKPFYLLEVQFQPDDTFYYRLFAELFVYLRQYQPPHPWQIVVIYPSRTTERVQTRHFGALLDLPQVRRIYLDELKEADEGSLGIRVVKLVVAPIQEAGEQAKALVSKVREQLADETIQQQLISLIETIVVYKLPQKSREEIEVMLGLSELKQTRFYQEVHEEGKIEGKVEGKLEAVSRLLQLGLSVDVIANVLDLPIELVMQEIDRVRERARQEASVNLASAIALFTSEPSLFDEIDCTELLQQIEPLADEVEVLWQVVSSWLESHPTLFAAHQQVLKLRGNGAEENEGERSRSDEIEGETIQNLSDKTQLQQAILNLGCAD